MAYNLIADRNLCLGKLIKVRPKKIILEWSTLCAKSWDICYIVVDYTDIESVDFVTDEKENKISVPNCNDKHQEWKVLYRSQPIFKSNMERSFVYVAIRKKIERKSTTDGRQFEFDSDLSNNPIRFMELPLENVPAAVFIAPGTRLKMKAQHVEEKYLSILNVHVKKLLALNPSIPSKRCVFKNRHSKWHLR